MGMVVGSGGVQCGTSLQWQWKLLVCSGLRGGADLSLPDVLLALFSERDAPKEYRGWMVGCLHTGACFPNLLLHGAATEAQQLQSCVQRAWAQTFQEQGLCCLYCQCWVPLGGSWARHGCECWRQVLSRSKPTAAHRASSGVGGCPHCPWAQGSTGGCTTGQTEPGEQSSLSLPEKSAGRGSPGRWG